MEAAQKSRGGFSSLLPLCAIILGEILAMPLLPLGGGGSPIPRFVPQRVLPGGGKRFGSGCGAGLSHA